MTNLYESLLAQSQALPAPAARPPKVSAAVVLWRRSEGGGLEVFWVRRSPELRFMGGWHAFPGGALSRGDAAVPLHGRPQGLEDSPADAGMPEAMHEGSDLEPNDLPGLAAAALRELFEETGVLVAHPEPSGALDEPRRRLLSDETDFATVLRDLDLEADAGRLVYAGRWLTPPLAPLRFDNRFFLLEWPADRPHQPEIVPGELAEGEWIAPAAAFEAWRRAEVMTSPPILHILKVLAEDGPRVGLRRLRWPDEANLGPLRKVEFRPGVTLLPLEVATLPPATHTNCYLLGHDEIVIVDPGSRREDQIRPLIAALEAVREGGRRLRAIWLTHHHPDHVGGVEALHRHFGLPIEAHPATAERLAPLGLAVHGSLRDGQRVVLGSRQPFAVRIFHTPGHARGHLCFLAEDHGSLVAGDLVAGLGTIVIDPPEGDMDDYLASLERMAELAPRTLFPAHGPVIADAVGHLRGYLAHRLERERRILDAWREGLHDAEQLVPRVYDDVPAIARPLAARQLEAHLLRLRKQGEIAPS